MQKQNKAQCRSFYLPVLSHCRFTPGHVDSVLGSCTVPAQLPTSKASKGKSDCPNLLSQTIVFANSEASNDMSAIKAMPILNSTHNTSSINSSNANKSSQAETKAGSIYSGKKQ